LVCSNTEYFQLAQSLGSSQFHSHRFVVICNTCSTLAHRLSDVFTILATGEVPCLTDTHHWDTAAENGRSVRKIWNETVSSVSKWRHGQIQQ
jgi:hypothetical protein